MQEERVERFAMRLLVERYTAIGVDDRGSETRRLTPLTLVAGIGRYHRIVQNKNNTIHRRNGVVYIDLTHTAPTFEALDGELAARRPER